MTKRTDPIGTVMIDTVPLPEIGTWPTPERAVRVTIPAEVAYDLKRMTLVTEAVLGRLGCPECHSGWDLRFDIERRFLVDGSLNVRSAID